MNRIGQLRLRYTVAVLSCGASLGTHVESAWATSRPFPIHSAVTTCATCNSLATLQAAALAYFNQWHDKTPPGFPTIMTGNLVPEVERVGEDQFFGWYDGTKLTVISTAYPIAADFKFTSHIGPTGSTWVATPVSATDDAGTRTLDNLMVARASRMPPIKIPSDITSSDDPEIVSAYVQSVVTAVGPPVTNFWHGLTNFGQFVSLVLLDQQNGKTYQVYVGDTITFQYSNGSTEKFQYLGPGPTSQWQRVPGSLRDASGKDPTKSEVQTPVTGAGASVPWSFDSSGNDGTTIVFYPSSGSTPAGVITIEELPDSTTYGDWD